MIPQSRPGGAFPSHTDPDLTATDERVTLNMRGAMKQAPDDERTLLRIGPVSPAGTDGMTTGATTPSRTGDRRR